METPTTTVLYETRERRAENGRFTEIHTIVRRNVYIKEICGAQVKDMSYTSLNEIRRDIPSREVTGIYTHRFENNVETAEYPDLGAAPCVNGGNTKSFEILQARGRYNDNMRRQIAAVLL